MPVLARAQTRLLCALCRGLPRAGSPHHGSCFRNIAKPSGSKPSKTVKGRATLVTLCPRNPQCKSRPLTIPSRRVSLSPSVQEFRWRDLMRLWPFPNPARIVQIRKRTSASFVRALIFALGLTATSVAQQSPCPVGPQYKYLRSDEDYLYLSNPACRTDTFDGIKYIALRSVPGWFASLGGEIREDVEYSSNPRWGQLSQGPAYSLQRFMINADLHLGENTCRTRSTPNLKTSCSVNHPASR